MAIGSPAAALLVLALAPAASSFAAGRSEVWSVQAAEGRRDLACAEGTPILVLARDAKARFWLCGYDESSELARPAANAYLVRYSFSAVFRKEDGDLETIDSQGEMMARPLEVRVSPASLALTSHFDLAGGGSEARALRPYKSWRIDCGESGCALSAAACAFSTRRSDDPRAIGFFDRAVRARKQGLEKGALLDSKVFRLLGRVFLLAAGGNLQAANRIRDFPLEVDGGPAEVLQSYSEYVDEVRGLCSRSIDSAPKANKLERAIPPGRAEAEFWLITGGDQTGGGPRETGLALRVRFQDQEVTQTFASCADAGHGTALGGGKARELEVGVCGGQRFWLVTGEGSVRVLRNGPRGAEVTRVDLPPGISSAVAPGAVPKSSRSPRD